MTENNNVVELPRPPMSDIRVTQDQVEAWMERVAMLAAHIEGTTTTVCHAFLDGKFYLGTETSSCVDPANFNEELGKQLAAKACIEMVRRRAWELLGYALYLQQQVEQPLDLSVSEAAAAAPEGPLDLS